MNMTEPDPYADDPFFKRIFDGGWNACIGRQGHEENYLDGYIEAAIELTDAIITKKMFDKRDTLVLPILYNARHAIELALKFATDRLLEAGIVKNDGIKRDHNIRAYWERLDRAEIGDEILRLTVAALKPFIDSVSRIDADGQELRYHKNRDDEASLANYSIANIKLIQHSLRDLEKLLSSLKYRIVEFATERRTGAYTSCCSRRDLFEIAHMMPARDQWRSQAFEDQKDKVKARFNISNSQFCVALNAIQKNREMAAILGIESDLLHLSDDDAFFVAGQWRRLHPKQERDQEEGHELNYFDTTRLGGMQERTALYSEIINAIEKRLSPDAVADLETIFFLARDGIFTEAYCERVEQTRKNHAAANEPTENIRHLVEKTNFLQCLLNGTKRLGRLQLANRLAEI